MSVREILVAFGDAAGVPRLLAPAAALAAKAGAGVTGLFASGYPIESAYGDVAGWMQLVNTYLDAQRGVATAAEAAFRQELAQRHLAGDWIYREGDATDSAIGLSALYDLVVVGQRDPEGEPVGALGLRPAEVVLGIGRPALVIPYAGSFAEIGRRVLIAWNASREAARAVHDAMFILEAAESVTVVEIEPLPAAAGTARVRAADIAAALTRRGAAATAETLTAGDIGVGELLLSRAADLGVDLLVMGAWGHSRLREYVLGGVSRGLLQSMTLPVLMAH